MATRVFLLSADEKAVHVITQILDEQDIRFEHSSDPTFTLKRLAGQHFDVLIVDCDNAESAMQVFNSARASSLNKGAIAIAIVEGKAGVPNAFRLGASLVLTKPVSLDQARNTLRTAVGMTRKDSVEARPAAVPTPALMSTPAPVLAPVPAPAHTPAAPVHAPSPASLPAPVHVVHAPSVPAAAPHVPATHAPVAPIAPSAIVSAPAAIPPQVISTKPAEPPAPVKIPAPPAPTPLFSSTSTPATLAPAASIPTPITPAASVVPQIVTAEKTTSTPLAVKPQPSLVLSETKIFKAAEEEENQPAPEKHAGPSMRPPALSLSSAMLGSSVSDAAIDKLETELTGARESKKSGSTFEMFAPLPKETTDSADDTLLDEPEDSAATLRASAVPAFGGLAKQPFAGLDTSERKGGRGLLIGGLAVAIVIGGFAAAWFYAPDFQKTLTWEYSKLQNQIHPAQPKLAPLAVQVSPAPAVPATTASSDPMTNSASTMPPAASGTSSLPAPANTPSQPAPSGPVPAPAPSAVPATHSPTATAAVPAKSPATPPPAPSSPAPSGNASLMNASATTTSVAKPAELFEVPEDYADDQVVHRVHPLYPKVARARKLQGPVVLQAIIDKQGKVDSLQLVSGDPLLAQAAADAVKQWRYKPYSHNGDPVEFQTRVTVDFKLPLP